MSIPFSNTQYRIPRGFANLLEGLTTEVLREQPQDIPHFAARYFAGLLKKREDSGFDPAEWSAKLEDRFYNNHSFQYPEDTAFTARTEDVFSRADLHLSEELTSFIQQNEEDEHKFIEDNTIPAQTEDITERTESFPVLDNSEDTLESPHRPPSAQLAEVEHKQEEESDADNPLRDQSATVIQAAFRGHQAREEVRKRKEEPGENERLSLQEYPASEEVDPHQDEDQSGKEREAEHEEDLEPHPAEASQEDPAPVQPDDSNIETRPETEDIAATEDVSSAETGLGEDLEMEQTHDLQKEEEGQQEDDQKNPAIENKAEDHDQQHHDQVHGEEDNLAVKEDVEGQDTIQTEDHREEDSITIEGDGEGQDIQVHEEEKAMVKSQGLEASGDLSSTEGTDISVTQETNTEEKQESADNQDNEAKEQLEDRTEEPAETTTKINGEQQEDREENEALRKQTDEALDIDLDDPDVNAAAAKIQAGFRGHMTRKKMKSGDKDGKHKEGKEGSSAQGEHDGD